MTNTNLTTNIRYGVIACNSLDPDLVHALMFGSQARDLSYEAACNDIMKEVEREADAIEDGVRIAIAEEDPSLVGNERWEERRIEERWVTLGYDDREDYIQFHVEGRCAQIEIEEPVIEGECEDVKYRIDWLGGAPMLWVLEGPVGTCRSLCSPCVPNAGDLDSGFSVRVGFGHECYVVPREWLWKED